MKLELKPKKINYNIAMLADKKRLRDETFDLIDSIEHACDIDDTGHLKADQLFRTIIQAKMRFEKLLKNYRVTKRNNGRA